MRMAQDCRLIHLDVSLRHIQTEVRHYREIDSTNAALLQPHKYPSGTVLMADYQSAGRGRLGRTWSAPAGEALLFSIFLETDLADPLYIYTFLAAVAVREALAHFIPGNGLTLKWPNDILLNDRKICGILVQSVTTGTSLRIVIGIGLNLNQSAAFFEPALPHASSLYVETGQRFERLPVLRAILLAIDNNLNIPLARRPDEILRKWQAACASLGKRVKVNDGQAVYTGLFTGLTPQGGLILQTEERRIVFHAADVTIVKEKPL